MNYVQFYRNIFAKFGHPLSDRTSLPESAINRAAARLDIAVPAALRDFYSVAGREMRFSQCHNRVIAPQDWRVSKKRLIFMEENQWVVWWGVSVRNPDNDDPPVSQAINDDEDDLTWYQENRRCSVFIAVMLHYQAVNGGFEHHGVSPAAKNLKHRLKTGWKCYGTLNRLTAYSRQNQVVCVEPDMGVLAAAKTKSDLKALQQDLRLVLT